MRIKTLETTTTQYKVRDELGRFAPGNTEGKKIKDDNTIYKLRKLLLDKLMDEVDGKPSVLALAFDQCIVKQPQSLLGLAAKLVPATMELDQPAFMPIVIAVSQGSQPEPTDIHLEHKG